MKEIPLNEISENLNILPKKIEGGVNFPKEIPLNEIFEKLKILLKNVRGGQFSKRNPFKWNFRKLQNFAQKSLMENPILL